MASIHGYTDGSYDYKHMYSIPDRRGPLPELVYRPGSLLAYLDEIQHPFLPVLMKTSTLVGRLNDPRFSGTIIIPRLFDSIQWDSLGLCERMNRIQQLIANVYLSDTFLQGSHGQTIPTRRHGMRWFVELESDGILRINQIAQVESTHSLGHHTLQILHTDRDPWNLN
jgi:hypothetical protein